MKFHALTYVLVGRYGDGVNRADGIVMIGDGGRGRGDGDLVERVWRNKG